MPRERRKLPDEELRDIKRLLDSVHDVLLDNNQNVLDAINLLKDLQKNLGLEEPPKSTLFQRFRNFFFINKNK